MATGPQDLSMPLLPHTSEYPTNGQPVTATILLIHGAFSSRDEWDLVMPYLRVRKVGYHLLLPDLPCHGELKTESTTVENKRFSIRDASSRIADLIRAKAINGKAKIIGLSLGALVAIDLISVFPDLVDESAFVSGYEIYPWLANLGVAPWFMDEAEESHDRDHGEKNAVDTRTQSRKYSITFYHDIVNCISGKEHQWPPPWPARTLIIAAGKRGILPTHDHPHDAQRLADIGRRGNDRTIAMTHPQMRHPWNRQDPKLFAETACAWFEDSPIPDGFQLL